MTPPAGVRLSGYSRELGLVIAVVLGPEGLGQIAAGQPVMVDLAEQGLPRGRVLVAFDANPEEFAQKLTTGEVEAVPLRIRGNRWRCPDCGFLTDDEALVVCPNDAAPLMTVPA